MAPDELERTRQLVQELAALVPRDGAYVVLDQYGGGPDEGRFIANQAGYLRFGLEFLKGGISPVVHEGNYKLTIVDLDYLVSNDSPIKFDEFVLDELSRTSACHSRTSERFVSIVLLIVFFLILVLALIGLGTVAYWLIAAVG